MILYNYFINLLEGLLLSSFVAYYFNLKKKYIYIPLMTILCFMEISISNYYNVFDEFLIFTLILSLFISLIKVKSANYFEKILICSFAGIFLFLANLVSVLLTTVLFNIGTVEIYTKNDYYIFCSLFSKVILSFFYVLICVFKSKYNNTLTIKDGWAVLLLCLTVQYMITILLETLLTGVFTTDMAITLTMALIIICVLFLFIFRRTQIDHENKLQYELELQKNYFSNENYTKMQYMSNEIVETEHRMMYILMNIKKYIDRNENNQAAFMIDQYIKKVKKFSSTINTNNPYFDFVLSTKINEFMYEDIYIKNTLFIFENPIYDSKEFCNLIIYLLDLFKENLRLKDGLSLGIQQENNFIVIELIGDLNTFEITEELYKKIEYFKADYSLKNIEDIYTLKLIIEI